MVGLVLYGDCLRTTLGLLPAWIVLASPLNEIIFVVAAQPDISINLMAGSKPWSLVAIF
jgi:hypothetical protein